MQPDLKSNQQAAQRTDRGSGGSSPSGGAGATPLLPQCASSTCANDVGTAAANIATALDRWKRAKETVASGWRTNSDLGAVSQRLMDLDQAMSAAEPFRGAPEVESALQAAHKAMMGGAA